MIHKVNCDFKFVWMIFLVGETRRLVGETRPKGRVGDGLFVPDKVGNPGTGILRARKPPPTVSP